MVKPTNPEVIVSDNPFGTIIMGPVGEQDKVGEDIDTNKIEMLKSGYCQIHSLNGSNTQIVPGCSHEILGTNLAQGRNEDEKENVAKSIVCENGDIVLNAANGNIKLIAKNIYIETVGDKSDGSILIKANDHITMKADEQLNLAGGKVCVTSADSITLNAKGYLRMLYADVIQGSPLSGILGTFIPGPVADLITDIAETCK